MAEFLVLDTGGAQSFVNAGGIDALTALGNSTDGIIVTDSVVKELFGPLGLSDNPTDPRLVTLRDWIMSDSKVLVQSEDLSPTNISRYFTGTPPSNPDLGDISIKKYIDQSFGDGNSYHIITDNVKDFDDFPRVMDQLHGTPGTVSVARSSYGALSELFFAGEIDATTYSQWRDDMVASRGENISPKFSNALLSDTDLSSYDPPSLDVDFATAKKMTVVFAVAKELGLVGDALDLVSNVVEISDLYQQGRINEAEAQLNGYIASIAGGVGGGFGGAAIAATLVAILVPEPTSSVLGVATLVGAIFGGVTVGSAADQMAQDFTIILQDKLNGGQPLLLDDIVGIIQSLDSNCLPSDTPITLANGTTKLITDICVGDKVLSFDRAGNLVCGIVDKLFRNTTQEFVRLSFDDGRDDLVATPGHRFLAETGDFMEIGHMLRLGGGSVRLVETDGTVVTARAELLTYCADTADLFEQAEAKATIFEGNLAVKQDAQAGWATYNFEVREHHTYIAGGIRVHNDSVLSFLNEGDTVLALNDNLTDMAVIRDVDGDGVDELVILDGYRDPANGVFDTRIEIANVYTPPAGTDIASVLGGIIDTNPNDLSANPLDPGLLNGYGDGVVSDDLDEVVVDDLGWSVTRTLNGVGIPSEDAILANPLTALSVIQPMIDILNALDPETQSYEAGSGDVVTPPYTAPDGTAMLASVLGLSLDLVIVPAVVVPGPFGDIEVTSAVTLGSLIGGLVSLPTDIALAFGSGIVPSDVTRAQDGDDLVLTIDNGDGTSSTWTLEDIYADGDTSEIASVNFADGTELPLSDISDGTAAPDGTITGTEEANIIDADFVDAEGEGITAGDDTIVALGGDDVISISAGNDTIDGGTDDDTVVLTGAWSDYTYGIDAGGADFTISDVAGTLGTDALTSIEGLEFSDGTIGVVSMASSETRLNIFEADGVTRSAYIRIDAGSTRDWESFVTVFGDAEVIASQVVNDDDGVVNTTTFVDGVRNELTIEDIADSNMWTSEVRSYDAAGDLTDALVTYDDGRVSDTTYVDGVRTEEVFSDIDDVLSWTTRTRTYDEQGALVQQVVNDDDGLILDTTYVGGVRTELKTTDAADAFVWDMEVVSYDGTGAVIDEVVTYDDGRVRDTTFVDGARTEEVFTDVDGVVSWETRTRTYNEDGSLASQLVDYDDGQSNETLYVAGVREMQTIEDVDDAFVWNTRVRDFDDTGTIDSETVTYDDGRVYETLYENGVQTVRSDSDLDDAFSWVTRETLYDLNGDRISLATVFDDGSTSTVFYDDAP